MLANLFSLLSLAARTNYGRATVLRLLSVRLLSVVIVNDIVTFCIVAKRCVLVQKLLLTGRRKSYTRNLSVPNE